MSTAERAFGGPDIEVVAKATLWEPRWTSSDPDGDGGRRWVPARHRADLRGARAAAGHLLPAAPALASPATAAAIALGPQRGGAHCGARHAPRAAVRGLGAGGSLCNPPR